LRLTQESTFIAFSENDVTGFNRWIPFYFELHMHYDYTASEIEDILENIANTLTLYSENRNALFSTNQLIWTAVRLSPAQYNITLVVIPDTDELMITSATSVERIVISTDKTYHEYLFSTFIIESRMTISGDIFYSSRVSIETRINAETLSINPNYGIASMAGYGINNFELIFPAGFANILEYEVIERQSMDDDVEMFATVIIFSSYEESIVFRPFIRIEYGYSNVGYIVPALPVFIN